MQSHDQREREFHNEWAKQTPLEKIEVINSFENITAQENRFILGLIGDMKGLKILDIGSGLGEASVYFALKGARVTANDLSPVMLDRCVALGKKYGVEISALLGSADRFDFGESQFDIIYGANVLHHVGDIESLLKAVKRALVPGGRFFFYDPLLYNPAIMVYRRLATKVRTEDEQPLRFSQLRLFRELFSEVHHREFWLTALLIFFKYFFVDGIHPNTDRYWKRTLREDPDRIGSWFNPLLRVDSVLLRCPIFRYLAWNIVIWGKA
jgi:2-polyprenyl-3-methyl-5-hydroxy-6-metoxy-1,4-benzoquinol methylase